MYNIMPLAARAIGLYTSACQQYIESIVFDKIVTRDLRICAIDGSRCATGRSFLFVTIDR